MRAIGHSRPLKASRALIAGHRHIFLSRRTLGRRSKTHHSGGPVLSGEQEDLYKH